MKEEEKVRWFKSSHSGEGGGCLEITDSRIFEGVVPTRDSKLTQSPVVDLSALGFAALVDHAKHAQL